MTEPSRPGPLARAHPRPGVRTSDFPARCFAGGAANIRPDPGSAGTAGTMMTVGREDAAGGIAWRLGAAGLASYFQYCQWIAFKSSARIPGPMIVLRRAAMCGSRAALPREAARDASPPPPRGGA